MAEPSPKPVSSGTWLSRNVLVLGLISLLTDTASEMVMPLMPVFLTVVVGGGALALGAIEGAAEATASVFKLLSGRWSDKVGRNRPFVIVGYTIASIVRPMTALAAAPWHVFLTRNVDRVGKGLRTSPRDALIAASVKPEQRGAAFGLHRAMDNAGATIGPLLAAAFLAWVSQDLRLLFALTAIPGVLVIITVFVGVNDVPGPAPEAKAMPRKHGLARFLVPLALFTLGNSSDLFLLWRATGEKPDLTTLPLLWVALHTVKALAAVPGGKLADKFGYRRVIAAGWLFYAAIYAAFGLLHEQHTLWALLMVYGLYYGLTEGAERALVAELAPADKRGAAYGWFHFTLGMLSLAASLLFGALWELASPQAAFFTGAGLALAAAALLAVLHRTVRSARAEK